MKEIIEFFKQFPCLVGCRIREDFLAPEEGSIAIAHDGGEQTLKVYTSGDMLGQICFKLLYRGFFTGEAGKIFDEISCKIAESKVELPVLSGGRTVQYIEITEGPAMIKTEVGAGVYEMKFRLVYYRKGERNE